MESTAMNAQTEIAGEDPRTAMGSDVLAEANRRASPQLTVASGFTPGMAAGVCGLGLLGLITFSSLSAQRSSMQAQNNPAVASTAMLAAAGAVNGQPLIPVRGPEQPPVLLSAVAGAPPVAPAYSAMPLGTAVAKAVNPATLARLQSPALVVDLSKNSPATAAINAQNAAKAANNAQGLAQAITGEERDSARAGRVGNPAFTVTEGTVLAGTLETAINSDLPGHVRAVVSRNVTSFDGSHILVPKGSRLVGQYQSNLEVGQKRTFIIWERLIRPDGVTIPLASPGTDSLGRAGVTGKVDTHFLRRFGAALLLSVIDAGSRALSAGSGNVVISGGAGGAAGAAGAGLQNDANIAPTIKVAQGTAIRIFLNRDLDFSGVGAMAGQ
jgi:type IV secretory pathway VirB10-like protein